MNGGISTMAKRELLATIRERYREAKREELTTTAAAELDALYDSFGAEPGSWPAIHSNGHRRRLARLADAARPVPGVLSRGQDQPRLVPGRHRP